MYLTYVITSPVCQRILLMTTRAHSKQHIRKVYKSLSFLLLGVCLEIRLNSSPLGQGHLCPQQTL